MRIIVSVITLFFCFSVIAKPVVKEGLFIFDYSKKYLSLFQAQPDLVVDLVSDNGYELYGPEGLSKWIDDLEISYNSLEITKRYGYYDEYPTNADNEEKLKELAAQYPNILKLFSIGISNQGRELWVVKISDNVEIDEVEPEFKYIANMHGNEITGREMMMKLIEDLAIKYYERDHQIARLINNTEIFIMPTLNPDGSDLHRRGNANWTDLNRDFPDFITDPANTHQNRAIETAAMMDFQASRKFVLSGNFHDGATVVNYPWDTTRNRFPFNNLIMSLSKEYASVIPGMYDSTSFQDGITNGADWYVIHGGMQDWSYFWHGDMQVTFEVSPSKWPSYARTLDFYQKHWPALITYMERVHQGAGIKFEEENIEGTIKIYQYKTTGKIFLAEYGFEDSEFYKVLETGKYQFIVKALDHDPINVEFEVADDSYPIDGNYILI